MAINIKNSEVEASIRKLALMMGVDLTEAVSTAVAHELQRSAANHSARLARMRAIADRVADLPIRDVRTDEEILGYDESGLPK